MFTSKYIFETRKTRSHRYFYNSLMFLCFLFLFYLLLCVGIIYSSKEENKIADVAFFKRPPDLIAVYTGDKGRIPYAVKKAKDYNQSNIFITGVYSKNTINTLMKPLTGTDQIDINKLEIDYLARNTLENVISTLRFLRDKNGMNNILIISHDYHIPRIKLIINWWKSKGDNYQFFYSGVQSDYTTTRSLKILFKEGYKLIRTFAFITIWDNDQPN